MLLVTRTYLAESRGRGKCYPLASRVCCPHFAPPPALARKMRVAATLLLLATLCVGVQSNGEYEVGSEVVLYANKVRPCAWARRHRSPAGSPSPGARVAQVGPFANPNEVYAFYSLPYCAPTEIETKRENLGALLKGDRPTKTRYDLKFRSKPKPA